MDVFNHHDKLRKNFSLLNNVTHVIDCECFFLRGKYFYREVSLFNLKELSVESYQCYMEDLPRYYHLSSKEKKTVSYQYKKIHGLKFYNYKKKDFFSQEEIMSLLGKKYGARKDVYFAYKGGDIESKLCKKLEIDCLNLEHFGIEKYDFLLKEYELQVCKCKHHETTSYCHCSLYEVVLFSARLFDKIQKKKELEYIIKNYYGF